MGNDLLVHIVDDDPSFRKSLEWLLESVGLQVRGHASAREFLDAYDPAITGCVVLDVCMPGMDGLDLQEKLRQMDVDVPVIVVTGYGDVPTAVQAMKRGAVDFLQKPLSEQTLLDRVHRAIAQDIERRRKREANLVVTERMRRLTRRERQVAELIVKGMSSRKIAAELSVAVKTVEAHRCQVMRKMRAKNVPQLVLMVFPVLSDESPFKNPESRLTRRSSADS